MRYFSLPFTTAFVYAAAAFLTIIFGTLPPTASALISPKQTLFHPHSHSHSHSSSTTKQHHSSHQHKLLQIRGGDIASSSSSSSSALAMHLGPLLKETLVSGTSLRAIGALYVVASLTVVPLTWYQTAYSFSVGYGLSVAAMAFALLASFAFEGGGGGLLSSSLSSAPSILAVTALIYGLRLGLYILLRERTVESKKQQFKEMNKTPPLKRTPLALGVSLLYAFMMSPILFALRTSVETGSIWDKVQKLCTGVAAFGMVLESVADQHKYEVKRKSSSSKEDDTKFVGPTTWSYKLCRHPNYLGEILHWVGLFGAGSVVFGKDVVPWVAGGLGLWGILSIMLGASSRLDTKQSEKYDGQPKYDTWKKEVTSSVIPFIK